MKVERENSVFSNPVNYERYTRSVLSNLIEGGEKHYVVRIYEHLAEYISSRDKNEKMYEIAKENLVKWIIRNQIILSQNPETFKKSCKEKGLVKKLNCGGFNGSLKATDDDKFVERIGDIVIDDYEFGKSIL